MNLAEIREKYPQYNDLSDEDLVTGLHNRHYSDLDFDDFSNRIGYQPRPPVAETPEAQALGRQVISPTIEPRLGVAGIPPYMSREEYDVTQRPEEILRERLERPTREPETMMALPGGGVVPEEREILPPREPGIYPAPPETIADKVSNIIRDVTRASKDRASVTLALAKHHKISPSQAEEQFEALTADLPRQPTSMELYTGLLSLPIIAGLMSNPVATIGGLAGFMALGEAESFIISKVKKKPYMFGEQRGLADLAPSDINERTKFVLDVVDFIGKGAVLGGGFAKLRKTNWYRRMTNRERGLVALNVAEMKNAGLNDAQILKELRRRGTTEYQRFKEEAIRKRRVGEVRKEVPTEPIIPPEPEVKAPARLKKPPTIEEVPKEVTLYRGERVGQEGANYYSPDKEWARQFTQSGQDKEISSITISKDKIYRPDKLPKAYGLDDADIAMIQEAGEKGFKAIWMDEGKGQPESVFIIDKKRLKPKPKEVGKLTPEQVAAAEAKMAAAMERGEAKAKAEAPPLKEPGGIPNFTERYKAKGTDATSEAYKWAKDATKEQYEALKKEHAREGERLQKLSDELAKLPKGPEKQKLAGVKSPREFERSFKGEALEAWDEIHGVRVTGKKEPIEKALGIKLPEVKAKRVTKEALEEYAYAPGERRKPKKVKPAVVKEPHKMGKEEYVEDFVKQATEGIKPEQKWLGYTKFEDVAKIKAYEHHRKFVQRAISEGKITKHPDYPELAKKPKKVVTVKEPREMTIEELEKESAYFDQKIKTEIERLDKIAPERQRFGEAGIEHLSPEDARRMTAINDEWGRRTSISAAEAKKRVAKKRAARLAKAKPPPKAEVVREPTKRPPGKAVILKEKEKLLAEIDKAIEKAPETAGERTEAQPEMVTFKTDGGAEIWNTKEILQTFRKKVAAAPKQIPSVKVLPGYPRLPKPTGKLPEISIAEELRLSKIGEPEYIESFPGFQNMYERWVARMKKKKARPKQDIKIFDTGKVVKQRPPKKAKGLQFPPVFEAELNVLKRMPELRPKPMGGWLENPIRTFEELGSDAKELYYRPIKEAEHRVALERKALNKRIKALRKGISSRSRRRIGAYATAQQPRGKAIIQAMGVGKVPELKPKEMKVYNALRQEFENFYIRLNEARRLSGKEQFGKVENYFTFIRDLGLLNRMGFNPTLDKLSAINQAFIHLKTTPFRFAKARVKLGVMPIELDAFQIFEQYASTAVRHIHLSPVIAKLREFALTFGIKKGDPGPRWKLVEEKPRTAKFLTEWLDFQAGQRPPTSMPRVIEKGLMKLNQNLTFAILSANIRSALIQPSALVNTVAEIGPKYTLEGIMSLFSPKIRKFVMDKSNLLTRDYDVAVVDAMAAIRAGRIGELKKAVGRKALKPLQLLDMETAKATWYGAYLKAKKEGNYAMQKAINYANDVVTRTQGSAAPSDVAPIQRTALGKAISLFQTFVINQWGFLTRDVLGVKNPRMKNTTKLKKLLGFLGGAIMLNIFYEDLLGINSPLPTPIKAFNDAIEEGEELPSATLRIAKEVVEVVPIVGGGLRYGKGILGATAETIQELAKGNKPVETALKLYGLPGVVQAGKMKRAAKRGETTYGIWVGKYTPKHKRKKKWYIEPGKED